jgi:hypothetical protein
MEVLASVRRRIATLTRLDRSKDIASNMRTDKKITITGLFLLVAAALLNIQHQSSLAFAAANKNVLYL